MWTLFLRFMWSYIPWLYLHIETKHPQGKILNTLCRRLSYWFFSQSSVLGFFKSSFGLSLSSKWERESRLCLELTWREGGGRQIAMQMIQTPFCVECRTEKCVSIRFLSPSFFKMLFEREEFWWVLHRKSRKGLGSIPGRFNHHQC